MKVKIESEKEEMSGTEQSGGVECPLFGGVAGATRREKRSFATLRTQIVHQMLKMASTSTSSTSLTPKRVFVTVGSTRFDKLVSAASSESFLRLLDALNYTHLTIQHGQSPRPALSESSNTTRIAVDTYQYKPTLHEDMKQADLIISHAGKALSFRVLQRANSNP